MQGRLRWKDRGAHRKGGRGRVDILVQGQMGWVAAVVVVLLCGPLVLGVGFLRAQDVEVLPYRYRDCN